MLKTTFCLGGALLAVLLLNSGCLFIHHKTEVMRKDEPKVIVAFESDKASCMFHAKYHRILENREEMGLKADAVIIPFITSISKISVLSSNALYNDAVKVCDSDGDHVITEAEAEMFYDHY